MIKPMSDKALRHRVSVRTHGAFGIGVKCLRRFFGEACRFEKDACTHKSVFASVLLQCRHGQTHDPLGQFRPNGCQERTAIVRFKCMLLAVFVHSLIQIAAASAHRGKMKRGNVHKHRRFRIPKGSLSSRAAAHRRFGRTALLKGLFCKLGSRHKNPPAGAASGFSEEGTPRKSSDLLCSSCRLTSKLRYFLFMKTLITSKSTMNR